MVHQKVLSDLFRAFPDAIINRNLEFVANPNRRVNSYFRLEDCETWEDVTAKVLEWLSREAYKSQHYHVEWRNKEVHEYHLLGINAFCKTNFSHDDIRIIYTKLGNRVNHKLTLDFIRSGYDISLLVREMSVLERRTATIARTDEIDFDHEAED